MNTMALSTDPTSVANTIWETSKKVAIWMGHLFKELYEKSIPLLGKIAEVVKSAIKDSITFMRTHYGTSTILGGTAILSYMASYSKAVEGNSMLMTAIRVGMRVVVPFGLVFIAGALAYKGYLAGNPVLF